MFWQGDGVARRVGSNDEYERLQDFEGNGALGRGKYLVAIIETGAR